MRDPMQGESKALFSRDGTRIAYDAFGRGNDVLLLANGLGGRAYSFEPLIRRFADTHRILTWDYRGLFDSEVPKKRSSLAIHHHVDDALAVLDAEGHDRAVVFGWSMGVQVALELAALEPSRVRGLVLLNGTYGHTMRTGLQPFVDLPGIHGTMHAAIEALRAGKISRATLRRLAVSFESLVLLPFLPTAGRRVRELRPALRRYFDEVLGESFERYLVLFQELDAHSVYHELPDIEAPTLVVSGLLDALTPARQSFEMARRMPHAEHLAIARSGHFSLLERPEIVLPAIARFLAERAERP